MTLSAPPQSCLASLSSDLPFLWATVPLSSTDVNCLCSELPLSSTTAGDYSSTCSLSHPMHHFCAWHISFPSYLLLQRFFLSVLCHVLWATPFEPFSESSLSLSLFLPLSLPLPLPCYLVQLPMRPIVLAAKGAEWVVNWLRKMLSIPPYPQFVHINLWFQVWCHIHFCAPNAPINCPGDIFVLRNAGNTCTHAEGSMVGSLEFCTGKLGSRLILVLGHTKCGAIYGATKTYLDSQPGKKAGVLQPRLNQFRSN